VVDDATAGAVKHWLENDAEAEKIALESDEKILVEFRACISTLLAAGPQEAPLYCPGEYYNTQIDSWDFWGNSRPESLIFARDGRHGLAAESGHFAHKLKVGSWTEKNEKINAVLAEYQPRIDEINAESKSHNDRLFEVAKPFLLAAREEKERIAAEAKEKADADQKAANKIKYAERIATGYWEHETGSYNDRRYSAPWCATVSFNGAKPVYSWGESTGKWGKSGLLRVECKPGDFIAWGQKDLRRPGNSENNILRMRADGSMESFDNATDAFKSYRDSQKVTA
jgi:hypothetical protein